MSKSGKPNQTNLPDGNRLNRKHRHSLQPSPVSEVPPSALRHTQSHRYDSHGRKKKKTSYAAEIPSIMENENSDDELEKDVVLKVDKTKSSVLYENEKRGTKAMKSKPKDTSNNAPYVFENAAFEGSLQSKRGSTATSSRAPSVQSLEIVREQYCCCAKRTKCERILLSMVIVLFIIVVVLVVVIVIVAKQDDIRQLTRAIGSLR